MTKKEYILAVIDTMPDREMWRWIKAMVQNDQLDDHTINMLVIIFKKAMDEITSVIKENKMIESVHTKEKFEQQKKEQEKKDRKHLAELDSILNKI